MKYTALLLLLFATSLTVLAQVPVKKDLMEMYDKYPLPPANSKEASSKVVTIDETGTSKCSAEKLFSQIDLELKNFEAEYTKQPKPTAADMPTGLSPDDMKKMSDPEMRKKMKSMSKEEKMKMAMEMMKSMPANGSAVQMDPPPIRAALDEWQKIYNDTQNEFQRSVALQQEEIKLAEEYQNGHADIAKWETEEITKLPRISSGEMSAPDPAKVKMVRLKSADKHITQADKRLEQIKTRLRTATDYAKKRYSVFYRKLIAADYALDSKNFSTKKILSDAQMLIYKNLITQVEQSRNAWEESAKWQINRTTIEKEKVE
ncbi:MAG: hypothetical protein C0417_03965 [Chlorobiaceae bacterium]|nr:hypothetical protein [Chlorobiaceae bacterium]